MRDWPAGKIRLDREKELMAIVMHINTNYGIKSNNCGDYCVCFISGTLQLLIFSIVLQATNYKINPLHIK